MIPGIAWRWRRSEFFFSRSTWARLYMHIRRAGRIRFHCTYLNEYTERTMINSILSYQFFISFLLSVILLWSEILLCPRP
ncbi:hypothetical protein BU24DRAFT_209075 [Aaosphaeria arxii CBS 175.79]|uniref:Uncharacterized protein n=1 Tax=Aaosphaeria arxii CBS 175.79 TaxID=1450172 RepID=A0A6A5XUW6_9PLEO|nr:uncharacterized protein BU24DRAFT_209075 [Aaosphaeria arxii CBS 175.79]KAF2016716.1 hypothetical protein BU24DRAFT_209075 [Aaosphaeria arxii CBS 175.79]